MNGDPAKLDDWAADDVPRITPGQVICVRVAVHNIGDRASEAALTNFVVPDCFDLRNNYNPEAKPAFSGNSTAGLPPDHRVAFLPIKLEPWTPGNTFIYSYQLTYSTSSTPAQPLRTRLLFDIADSHFNRTGRRWFPSLLPPLELGHAQAGEPWPPRSGRQWFRRVQAAPDGRVACSRGNRRDVRDFIVVPPPALVPPTKNRRRLHAHRGLARLVNRAARALPGSGEPNGPDSDTTDKGRRSDELAASSVPCPRRSRPLCGSPYIEAPQSARNHLNRLQGWPGLFDRFWA